MTREEAIEMLNKWGVLFPSEASESIDMAIEALSADTIPIEKYHELQHQFVMLGATFADLTEVVRCKDCRFSSWNKYAECLGCYHFAEGDVDDNDFCSHGERREP